MEQTLQYSPVTKKGKFLVEGYGQKATFAATFGGDAKFLFIKKFNIPFTIETLRAISSKLTVTIIRPTERLNG